MSIIKNNAKIVSTCGQRLIALKKFVKTKTAMKVSGEPMKLADLTAIYQAADRHPHCARSAARGVRKGPCRSRQRRSSAPSDRQESSRPGSSTSSAPTVRRRRNSVSPRPRSRRSPPRRRLRLSRRFSPRAKLGGRWGSDRRRRSRGPSWPPQRRLYRRSRRPRRLLPRASLPRRTARPPARRRRTESRRLTDRALSHNKSLLPRPRKARRREVRRMGRLASRGVRFPAGPLLAAKEITTHDRRTSPRRESHPMTTHDQIPSPPESTARLRAPEKRQSPVLRRGDRRNAARRRRNTSARSSESSRGAASSRSSPRSRSSAPAAARSRTPRTSRRGRSPTRTGASTSGGWDPEKAPLESYLVARVIGASANERRRKRNTCEVWLDEEAEDDAPRPLRAREAPRGRRARARRGARTACASPRPSTIGSSRGSRTTTPALELIPLMKEGLFTPARSRGRRRGNRSKKRRTSCGAFGTTRDEITKELSAQNVAPLRAGSRSKEVTQ